MVYNIYTETERPEGYINGTLAMLIKDRVANAIFRYNDRKQRLPLYVSLPFNLYKQLQREVLGDYTEIKMDKAPHPSISPIHVEGVPVYPTDLCNTLVLWHL